MKRMWLVLCASIGMVQADWKISMIYNNSDLHLDGAFRKKGDGNKKSTSVDGVIKKAKNKSATMINYIVPKNATESGYLYISLSNPLNGQVYELAFDSQATHALTWKRSKAQKIAQPVNVEQSGCSVEDGTHCARVVLNFLGTSAAASAPMLVAQAMYPYSMTSATSSPILMDVTLSGASGSYQLSLTEA